MTRHAEKGYSRAMRDEQWRRMRDRRRAVEDLCGWLEGSWRLLEPEELAERDVIANRLRKAVEREFAQYNGRRRWHPESTPSRRAPSTGSLTS